MNTVSNFVSEIRQDCSNISKCKNNRDGLLELRIQSVGLRVFGTFLAACAVGCFIIGTAALLSSPLSGICGIITAVAFAVLAHDLIKIGINIKKISDISLESTSPEETVFGKVCRVGKGFWNCAKAGYNEVASGVPYSLQGTILFEPIYKMGHRQAQYQ